MFLDSVGIILRKNGSSPYKMIILDKIQGKIECVIVTPSFSTGSLITYNIRLKGTSHFISDSILLYIPLSLAQADILFFHHILELIYYFTYVGGCSQEIFDLLAFLYSIDHGVITSQFKKLFLLKLLTSMGSAPERNEFHTKHIAQLSMITIRQLTTMTIDKHYEQELDKWLWCCVWQHPYVNEFKTVHFLAKNRTL